MDYKVQETKAGQLFITLPRALANALSIKKFDKISFMIAGKNRLMIIKK